MTKFVEKVAEELNVPKFYVELKVGRFGEKVEDIKASIEEDRATCKAISESLSMAEGTVWKEFIGQLGGWKGAFAQMNIPTPPEELVKNSLKGILSQRFFGKTQRLAFFIDVGKTQTAKNNASSKFRWVTLMVEPDQPGKPWQTKKAIHWGAQPTVNFGEPYNVVLEERGGERVFITLTEFAPSNKKLPDVIPGDIRARVRFVAAGTPYTKSGVDINGREYSLEGLHLVLVVDKGDKTEIVEGSTLRPAHWLEAPHGKALNTTIVEKTTSKGKFYDIGEWHIAKDQSPIPYPKDLPYLINFSDEVATDYLDDIVIYDGIPGSNRIVEGKNGQPIQFLEVQNILTKSRASIQILEHADVDPSLLTKVGNAVLFDAARIRLLTSISQYTQNGRVKISRQAYAVWPVGEDEVEEESIKPRFRNKGFADDPLLDRLSEGIIVEEKRATLEELEGPIEQIA